MDSPVSASAAAGPSGSVPASNTVPPAARTKSKSYGSTLAKEGDVQKYRAKYKDLKLKVKEIEKDNDKIILKIQKAKRAIQRVRMERALIYERLVLNPLPPSVTAAPPPPLDSFLVPPPPSASAASIPPTEPAPETVSVAAPSPASEAVPSQGEVVPPQTFAGGGLGLVDIQALPGQG